MKNVNLVRIVYGLRKIRSKKILALIPFAYAIIIAILTDVGKKGLPILGSPFSSELFGCLYVIFMVEIAIIGCILIVIALGMPLGCRKIEQRLKEIGLVDKTGNSPKWLSRTKEKKGWCLEFYSPLLPLREYEKNREKIETVMNVKIVSFEYGSDMRHVLVKVIAFRTEKEKLILWSDELLDNADFTIKLGESHFGEECCDLAITPHWLIGGGSGSGKSKLLKLILMQCIKKRAIVYLADFKGGVDYPEIWHRKCSIITEPDSLNEKLDKILEIMERRRELFIEAGTPNLNEYNQKTGSDLQRIIVACDEVAEVMDKTGLDKDEKAVIGKLESKISTIARLGRAFGIHLILAMQRPDSDVLKGQIKNNIGFRICGRADRVLSQIILDNSEGAEKILPDDQGMFVTNTNVLFKAYYVEDDCLKGGTLDDGKTRD